MKSDKEFESYLHHANKSMYNKKMSINTDYKSEKEGTKIEYIDLSKYRKWKNVKLNEIFF